MVCLARLQKKPVKSMPDFLGIDTSNYTTSAALYREGRVFQQKKLLPVRAGQLGLRQSDAVFHHVQQLPDILEELLPQKETICAIGVSTRPRSQEGSYMPCFTVGHGAARQLAAALNVPVYVFSHQAGHIAAALFSAGKLALLKEPFLAFHVSGGTTEAVLVTPDETEVFHAQLVAASLDLKGGQAVDRVGTMLGLSFPCGPALEQLALKSTKKYRIKPSLKGADCSLSGVQNQCEKLLREGALPEDIARYCLDSILAALDGMTQILRKEYGTLPLLFAGGVMSNGIIREALTEKYGAFFAEPVFSSDNAAGVAVLAALSAGQL